MRLVGAVIPIKVSFALEVTNLFFVALGIVFAGEAGVDWPNVGLTVVFCGLASLLYWIDNAFYLYVVEDDNEEET